ncbi:MAG: Hpt domain-containing protein [Rhizobiales bacterium]|nr:Hpt domain-containing protein [Hyphomicrobiales bacterium]OJU33561.1 MAG: hypothetical protein BGN94_18480 [Rhizobiales bacterium 68-8]
MHKAPTAAELALLDPDGTFAERLAGDRAAFAALAAALDEADDDGALADIQLLAHRLGGAAGTFGYAEVGEAALDLEESIIALREGEGDSGVAAGHLAVLLATLDVALRLK